MVPQLIDIETGEDSRSISNSAWVGCAEYDNVSFEGTTYEPRLLLVLPKKADAPLVFDPPPQVA